MPSQINGIRGRSLPSTTYVFIDEGGDLNFSSTGTRFFTVTSATLQRPFPFDQPLLELRYDLMSSGLDIELFHAAQDRQAVRNQVFRIIHESLNNLILDSIIVDKSRLIAPVPTPEGLYVTYVNQLINQSLSMLRDSVTAQVIVITDKIPLRRKRRAIEKAIKTSLGPVVNPNLQYRLYHHESKSCIGLQVVDYCNWALFRAWERKDPRSFNPIKRAFRYIREPASPLNE